MQEKFFPMVEGQYFTIQGSSGQQAKCYDYFSEVLDILAPFLKGNNIEIVQLGGKDDKPIPGCRHLMGQTTIPQAYYLLRRAFMHIGNDSWQVHAAASMGKPVVALYGSTSSWVHGPYFANPDRMELIDSHRNGKVPSYSNENPKTVNFIRPEQVADAILRCCGVKQTVPQETILVGVSYQHPIIEYVPDFVIDPNFMSNAPITIRMDYLFDEEMLVRVLSMGRRLNIITSNPIKPELIKHFKSQIIGVTYDLDDSDDPAYIRELRRTGIKNKVICREKDEKAIADLRLRFFDACPNIEFFSETTKEQFLKEVETYRNSPLDSELKLDTLYYRSNKLLLSKGKVYSSKAGWRQDQPIPSPQQSVQRVFDTPEFWEEFHFFRIFKKLHEEPTTPSNDGQQP